MARFRGCLKSKAMGFSSGDFGVLVGFLKVGDCVLGE